MHEPTPDTRLVEIAPLGERLAPLRLCDATALAAVRRSLERHGQLTALTLFVETDQLEILDGFKRVRAARALGWTTLLARIDDVDAIEAKLRVAELHDRRGLTELEEAWLVRSLYRDDGLGQPEIARRMSRHKSWVWRRLMLVESLEPAVQAHVRLGLLAPRAAVAVSRLPRGNQIAASTVVARRGLTVRQTDLLVQEVLDRDGEEARADLLARRLDALAIDTKPGLRPTRACATRRTGWPRTSRGCARSPLDSRRACSRRRSRRSRPAAAELLREALGRLRAGARARSTRVIGTAARPEGRRMTASWRSREELVHQIVTLARDGLSRRAITRAVGVSRNTVKAVLAAHQIGRTAEHAALRPRPARAPRASKLDRFKPRIAELMTQFPDITAQRVFESLRAEGFDGGYNTVKKYVRSARPKPQPQPSLATPEYGPGEMAESDWSPYAITFTDGQRMIVQALSYVLVHSKRKSFALFTSNDLHALMDGHAQAFERFEGVRANASTTAKSPSSCGGRAASPSTILASSRSRATTSSDPSPCAAAHPNDKPRTERSFWEVERSFLNGRSFRDLDDMRAQLAAWMDEIVDSRRRHKRTALERFADEREHLVPLPASSLRHRSRRLPRLRHRRLHRLEWQPLRRSLRPRHRHPARARHAA